MRRETVQTGSIVILCLIAVLTALRVGEALFAPMVAAVVLGVVCAPLTDRIERLHVPRVAAALLVLALFLIATLTLFFLVEPTISKAIRNAPLIWRELTDMLDTLRRALAGIEQLQDSVTEALSETNEAGAAPAESESEAVSFPGVLDALAYAPSAAASFMVFVGTLYFFLVARGDIYGRAEGRQNRLTRDILCRAEARVSRYFLAVTLINAGFGCLVAVAMMTIGLASPLLWGLAAFLVNFILYLGPASFAVALLIAGLVQFDGAYSFLPAFAYVLMNTVEGQFVTPTLVGRHLRVNPLLVFVSLVFWLWLWGPVGGVVAIPILVWSLFVIEQINAPNRPASLMDESGRRVPIAS